ncbi:MAG TPA: Gfo/Idh/MocA family oxidoreductase [Oscillospiraceae bacterium]|nr:Gfo/Idh/MocA family oxidoreductase [Oscillospiraceae bacterium]HPS34653.1 Gfo/Idh/MocA family oxidoreductase [Oscillospiraceae bacterium]
MFHESVLGQPLNAVIVGGGHRSLTYAFFAQNNPDKLKIVGVADPNPLRRAQIQKLYNLSNESLFGSAEALATVPRFADAVINGTMDQQHVATSIPLLRAGYHILLEKPFAINEKEMWELVRAARENKRRVMICHVMRYAPFYVEVKKRVAAGDIGEIVAIETTENVSYHHIAVGYIRGKWRNTAQAGHNSMLLAKCCHDIDMIMWMMSGIVPAAVSSFGSNFQFKPEKAPAGAGTRCLVDCPPEVESKCLYSARKNYLDHPDRWSFYVWDNLEHLKNPTLADKEATLKTDSIYGRCVYKCDNETVDHQTVNIRFQNGVTASHNMLGGAAKPQRTIHIVGTKGEITGVADESRFVVRMIDPRPGCEYSEEIVDLNINGDTSGVNGGHGGGDQRLVEDFVQYVQGGKPSLSCTSIADSVYGHLAVFRADDSMKNRCIMDIPAVDIQ